MSEVSFKLKGNESFNIREGWLNKGIEAIREDPTVFTQSTAMDTLGVGSKMVKSIRFWMQATGLAEETRGTGKRRQNLTEDFGKIIAENDPYFEDVATLWLIHSKIIARKLIILCSRNSSCTHHVSIMHCSRGSSWNDHVATIYWSRD